VISEPDESCPFYPGSKEPLYFYYWKVTPEVGASVTLRTFV